MNKRIFGIVYIVGLIVTILISLISMPVYLVWLLRGAAVVAALFGVYLINRNKNAYRYEIKEDREKKTKGS